jgi:hypothetical protein
MSMATILVSFEIDPLASQFNDYEGFVERLQGYPQWAQLHHSAWLVRTFDSARRVTEDLEGFVAADGRLFVARVGRDAAWSQVACGSEWLYENLWP